MKNINKIILVTIFSFFIIGAIPHNSSVDFNRMEVGLSKQVVLAENGVKFQYYSKLELKKEQDRILDILNKNNYYNLEINSNKIIYKDKDKSIDITLWSEGDDTRVEIIFLNNNRNILSFEIEKELKQFKSNSSYDNRYFRFIKYRLERENLEYSKGILEQHLKENTLECLPIHNGHIIKGKLKDNQWVNLAFVKYDTTDYVIIGTPVIFVTY